jgi:hypothetical protein
MRHPSEENLALFAGGELNLLRRWRIGAHVVRCAACQESVEQFTSAREWLQGNEELPPEIHWGPLAAEMKANIRVGLAAGQCVAPAPVAPIRLRWRVVAGAASVASFSLLLISVLIFNRPGPHLPATEGIVLEATPAGVELKQEDRALSLLQPHAEDVTVSVDATGVVRAGYVDSETGYVTINNVYSH